MLTLNPGCLCEVCAEEYGARRQPHSIPCGHVLCSNCANNIITKTSTRLTPVCPFCREQFTRESIRLIRFDFGGSGCSTPKRVTIEAPDIVTDIFRKDDPKLAEKLPAHSREEARRLEHKVARIAAQKSSVEEVSLLHQELQAWLSADAKQENQSSALVLSAALLRAILVNHVSHSEATKAAKNMELAMKDRLDDLEAANDRVESELRSLRAQYSQKAQECQTIKQELTRYKISPSSSPAPAFATSSAAASSAAFRPRSAMSYTSPPSSPATPAPTSPTMSHAPTHHSPLARSSHSSSSSSRSQSISYPRLTKTPSPPSTRPNSPPATSHRSRLASPQPHQMVRSMSADEGDKDRVHQRWLPMTADPEMFGSKSSKYASSIKSVSSSTSTTSRTIAAALQPSRYGTPVSTR